MDFGSCMIEFVAGMWCPYIAHPAAPDRFVTLSGPAGGTHGSDTVWCLKGLSEDVQIIILSQSNLDLHRLSFVAPTNLWFSLHKIPSSVCSPRFQTPLVLGGSLLRNRPQWGEIVLYTFAVSWNDNCLNLLILTFSFHGKQEMFSSLCFISLCCNVIFKHQKRPKATKKVKFN